MKNGTAVQIWKMQWALPYESAYSLLLKYAWANPSTGQKIARYIFRKDPLYSDQWSEKCCLLFDDWINLEKLRFPDAKPLLKGVITHYSFAAPSLCSRHFRYCEECISSGYHSVFFQIQGILRCPIHEIELRENCVKCGAHTGEFALSVTALSHPYQCSNCYQSIGRPQKQLQWEWRPEQLKLMVKKLMPIEAWFRRLNRRKEGSRYHSRLHEKFLPLISPLTGAPTELILFQASTTIARLNIYEKLKWSSDAQIGFSTVEAKLISWATKREDEDGRERELLTTSKNRMTIKKSIKRYIKKRILKKNRRCISRAECDGSRTLENNTPRCCDYICGFCPITEVLKKWWGDQGNFSCRNFVFWCERCASETHKNFDYFLSLSTSDSLWAKYSLLEFYSWCAIILRSEKSRRACLDSFDRQIESMRSGTFTPKLWIFLISKKHGNLLRIGLIHVHKNVAEILANEVFSSNKLISK
jgi:hypothetical protein